MIVFCPIVKVRHYVRSRPNERLEKRILIMNIDNIKKGWCAMKTWFPTVAVAIVFIAVLVFAWLFMDCMVDVLKQANRMQDVASSTNTVRQAAVVMNVSGIDNKVERGDLSVVAAYDSLSTQLSSWMSIMGIFATVFGLLIPIGSYLLQQKSLSKEKEELTGDVKDRIKEMKEEMEKIGVRNYDEHLKLIRRTEEKISAGLIYRMQPMWNFLASNFDRFLINDARKIETGKVAPDDVVNFLIGFDIYLDCLVRAENAGVIIEAIYKYRTAINTARNNPILWQEVLHILKIKIHESPDFVSGSEFERLIGIDKEKYGWLKSLYDEIIPWKFGK